MCLLERIQFHGRVKNRVLSLDLVKNPSIEKWHILHARLCGSINFWQKSVLKPQSQQSSSVTTRLPFILDLILFSINELNTEIYCHFICEKIQLGLISTGYVNTGEQLWDIFTKALSGDPVCYLCNKLGMINIYAPT